MTENEAIEIIQTEKQCVLRNVEGCDRDCKKCDLVRQDKEIIEAYDMAISSLKEMQQYKLIKDVTLGIMAEALKEFSEIGTIEECREAVEKQRPKRPKDSLKINPVIDENGAYVDADVTVYLLCPNCGERIGIGG